jgi:hypothetical protein
MGRSGAARSSWWHSFRRSPVMTIMAAAAEAEFELLVVAFFGVLYVVMKGLNPNLAPDYAGIYQTRPQVRSV